MPGGVGGVEPRGFPLSRFGIHWGTFERLTPEPMDQPLRDLAAARVVQGVAEEEFFVLRHGQTRLIE